MDTTPNYHQKAPHQGQATIDHPRPHANQGGSRPSVENATATNLAASGMDARLRARRIEVLRAEGRQRLRRLLFAVAVTVLLLAAWGVTRSPLLDVDSFVVSGSQNTNVDLVVAQSGLAVGDALIDVDVDSATESVLLLPWVQDAQINRSWSGQIEIQITERIPVALVQDQNLQRWLIDTDGRVLGSLSDYLETSPTPDGGSDLVLISGVVDPVVGEVLEGMPSTLITLVTSVPESLAELVQTVYLDANHEIWFELIGVDETGPGGRIRFGDARSPLEQLRSANLVITQVDLTDLDVIDVRVPSDPVVTRLVSGSESARQAASLN